MNSSNWINYINAYDDLKHLDTFEKALYHWNKYGKKEGRIINNHTLLNIQQNNKLSLFETINKKDKFNNIINNKISDKIDNIINDKISDKFEINNIINNINNNNTNFIIKNNIIDNDNNIIINNNVNNNNNNNNNNKSLKNNGKLIIKNNKKIKYIYSSDINKFIKYCIFKKIKHGFILLTNKNHIDVDLLFYNVYNNLNLKTTHNILEHFYFNGYKGLIYHPKQLINIYGTLNIEIINDEFYINYEKINIHSNNLYNYTFDELAKMLIKQNIYNNNNNDNNNNNKILVLAFIGNYNIGMELILKILKYKNIENFSVSFCISNNIEITLFNDLKNKIINDFDNYYIYTSNEFGNDIVPTLLMYHDIKYYDTYKYIIKTHTKNNKKIFNDNNNFLFSTSIQNFIKLKYNNCNCVSHPDYYILLNNDVFNKILINNYIDKLNVNNYFVYATMFFCMSETFDKVLDFVKLNNYRSYIFNNMYDNNTILWNNSPVHFLERLFGTIILN
jgi:hypothetical protein